MLIRHLPFLAVSLLLLLPASRAEETSAPPSELRPVKAVVELFTSQGCSSCPPADELLKTYIDGKEILALSLPVDYWDYIGWKDTLASPKNTERQRAYAEAFQTGSVYTPQVVVNGTAQAVGSNRREIDQAINDSAKSFAERRVPVHFWNNEGTVVIETGTAPAGAKVKEATIWLVVLQKSVDVPVKRGENGGRTLTYHNVVREMTPVGVWTGKPTLTKLARTAVMRPETEDSVVIVQEANNGPIIGAAWIGP